MKTDWKLTGFDVAPGIVERIVAAFFLLSLRLLLDDDFDNEVFKWLMKFKIQ